MIGIPYAKLILPAVAILSLSVGAAYLHHKGVVSGRMQVQTKFDSYVHNADALAAKQAVENAAKLAAVKENNDEQISHYKLQLADSTAFGQSVSRQLRNALAKAGSGGMPQGSDKPGVAGSGPQIGVAEIADAVGRTASECRDNADQLDALINEISPQVTHE